MSGIFPATGTISPSGFFGNQRSTHVHAGVDIGGTYGSPVSSVVAGTVVASPGADSGYGTVVNVQGNDGFFYRYAHLADRLVSPGDTVSEGQQIGTMGNSGVASGFTHLHFEKRTENDYGIGSAVDPGVGGAGATMTGGGSATPSSVSGTSADGTPMTLSAEPDHSTSDPVTAVTDGHATDGTQWDTASGGPLWISNASDVGTVASKETSAATDRLTSGVTAAEKDASSTATTIASGGLSGLTDLFVRGGFLTVGLLVLVGAGLLLYMERRNVVELTV